ncbi:cation transport regulator ChaC [Rhizobium sp. BE258]|nr:cation transport regulator ChaC [Rhizobium sp. BE258]
MNIRSNNLIRDFSPKTSLLDFLCEGPLAPTTWLFVYDIWMIRPLVDAVERQPALVRGWRRSVSAALDELGAELPLTLIPNGSTHGALLSLSERQVERVWKHWVDTRGFRPAWVNAWCSGKMIRAMAFVTQGKVVDRPPIGFLLQNTPEASAIRNAGQVARELNSALREMNVSDNYLSRLERGLKIAANGNEASLSRFRGPRSGSSQ